ncbi:L-threonylcarbamoyladenylate synthase [Desulfovirgula thermocuniculi]|uniref:L-threonylcarbamoyladenylate synthase n=1 Tax=Desulfovirgula thermocuniculi TaxID=348842 RepID=UPI000427FDFB|nr:L-threonylcarbamoyladenylate synthase [Desulfovirgula thermocuniculi]
MKAIETLYWSLDPVRPDPQVLARAGKILRRGGLVAFPTETVYGLGASALDPRAVARIFEVKGRPQDNPLIVHVAGPGEVAGLVEGEVPPQASLLIKLFWPGPLTLVLPAAPHLPPQVTAGLPTVALRMPAHPVALGLIAAAGVPVAAPSANLSGRPSPTTAQHVLEDLGGRIEAVLDAGPAAIGLESTVLDLTGPVPLILRPGGITPEELAEVLGEVRLAPGAGGEPCALPRPRSPGMKYRHYAPRAPLLLVEGDPQRVAGRIAELARGYLARGKAVGILAYEETAPLYRLPEGRVSLVVAGSRDNPRAVAAALFGALRRLDALGVDVILAEGMEPRGVGLAVMNRLRRAAGENVEKV